MRFSKISIAALMLAAATPALAQEETESSSPITISGSATVVSDYRFRGFSQSNEEVAIQGGITVTHDSGLYVGTWGSSIGFANGTEIDVYGGYSKEIVPGLTADVGATLYLYPGTSGSSIIEPYLSLKGTVGPATIKGGIAWAPSGQNSLGDDAGVYLYSDVGVAIPSTPITLKGHLGYSKSDSFLGGLDGEVIDYSIGADVTWKALTLGISYVNTDETKIGGWKEAIGADGAVLFSIGAAF
ncbi:TorF family putative porin [Sphingomonas canadensis]|uniref:TorF family putative porin n=1 Tax=Sphingomonas canadensis TaxID=1219257 RepID=A0ABW3H3G6_9SPHN|nr:TorF family putative porin [Sphingomonas canadensis]MCW3835224.1 TorF family putative porin [Sphingomonas canadensis]